jgi:hypothetical protein
MFTFRTYWIVAMVFILFSSPAFAAEEGENPQGGGAEKGLQQRIDFGNAYILGQSIKSGAVYLLHRKQSELKGMLEVRQNYREEIKQDYSLEKTAIVREQNNKQPEPEKKQ